MHTHKLILRNWLTHCGGWQVQNLEGRPAGQRPREELMSQLEAKGRLEEKLFFLGGPQSVFSSDLQLIDCTRPTPIMEGSLLYSKDTD